MTKLVANVVKIKSIDWQEFDPESGDNVSLFQYADDAQSCCGVIEFGEIVDGKFLRDLRVYSVETEGWAEAVYERRPTIDEVLEKIRHRYKDKGMAVCYLLDNQHDADFGRLLRYDKWKYHGKFWNPHTRNTLHHWSKVIHTGPKEPIPSKSTIKRK